MSKSISAIKRDHTIALGANDAVVVALACETVARLKHRQFDLAVQWLMAKAPMSDARLLQQVLRDGTEAKSPKGSMPTFAPKKLLNQEVLFDLQRVIRHHHLWVVHKSLPVAAQKARASKIAVNVSYDKPISFSGNPLAEMETVLDDQYVLHLNSLQFRLLTRAIETCLALTKGQASAIQSWPVDSSGRMIDAKAASILDAVVAANRRPGDLRMVPISLKDIESLSRLSDTLQATPEASPMEKKAEYVYT